MSPVKKSLRLWKDSREPAEEALNAEFPPSCDADLALGQEQLSRRAFLKYSAAAAALMELAACKGNPEKIVPYVRMAEYAIPGRPRYYATALTSCGYGIGVLVESHEGRPTRIRGNPEHPLSLGAIDVFSQAEIWALYDPLRSKHAVYQGSQRTRQEVELALRTVGSARRTALVTENITSSVLSELIDEGISRLGVRWFVHAPVSRKAAYDATGLVFGEALSPRYDFRRASRIVSLGGDFLGPGPGQLLYANQFSNRRRETAERGDFGHLMVAEADLTNTGAMADTRLAVEGARLKDIAAGIADRLGVNFTGSGVNLRDEEKTFVEQAALSLSGGADGLLVAGELEDPSVQALCHAVNHSRRFVGETVFFTAPPERQGAENLGALVRALDSSEIDTVIFLSVNPAYSWGRSLELQEALKKAKNTIHCGLHLDETAQLCQWHIPLAHELESWGDCKALDGSSSIRQPLILPLFGGLSATEIVSLLLGKKPDDYGSERLYWENSLRESGGFDEAWREALRSGVISKTALPRIDPPLRQEPQLVFDSSPGLSITVRPDLGIYDGRYSTIGWLQEMPRPLTRLTWDNALLVSPKEAGARGLKNGDVVRVAAADAAVELPVMILPGLPEKGLVTHMGFGRLLVPSPAKSCGFNVYPLMKDEGSWRIAGVHLSKTDRTYPLANTQDHWTMNSSEPVKLVGLEELRTGKVGEASEVPVKPPFSMYPARAQDGPQWGMSIDLSACIGCSACVIACQAENNVPIVGKDEVLRNREMHWLRVDRYYSGPVEKPKRVLFQPVPCMHCEHAPCELVCPVAATLHSADGLNEMIYNRCVGTRYCSNNCPYKVRRFNFFHYTDQVTPLLAMLQNPNVTVRSRGVMEKCTYCVQRIQDGYQSARSEHRDLGPDEVKTACQEACPVQAIVFGDLSRPSAVSKRAASPLTYGVLTELNTRPRTTYLRRIVRDIDDQRDHHAKKKEGET